MTLRYLYTETGSQKSNSRTLLTNASGEFTFRGTDVFSVGITEVFKKGYITKFGAGPPIQDDEENTVEIKMTRLDGVLNLKIINETGTNDTIYAGIVNKCEYVMYWYNGFHQLKKYPLVLQKGDHYEETFYACAGVFTTIKWGKVNIQGVAPADSVLIAGNDTSYYTIKY